MRCLISPSPSLSSASTTILRPPSKLPTTIWEVIRPAPSFRRLKLRRSPLDETVALRPRCLVVRAQSNRCHLDEPNHFVEEFQTIVGRFLKIHRRRPKKKKFYVPADLRLPNDEVLNKLCYYVCRFASEAVIMASQLVDSGGLTATGLSTKICADTVSGTLGEYVDVFLYISNDCYYKKKFNGGTVIRFVGALRGLGSISHILLEDALEAINHTNPREGLLEYTFNSDVKNIHRNFNCKMDDLEDGIRKPRADPIELAFPTIDEGIEVTGSFLDLMLARRQRTLEKACGGSK